MNLKRPGNLNLSKQTKLLIVLSAGLIIVVVVLIILLNIWKEKPENKPDTPPLPPVTKEETVEVIPTEEPEPVFTDVEFGSADFSREFFDKDLFIGDSIAMGFSDYQKLDASKVAASVSMTPYKAHEETITLPDGTIGSPASYAEKLQPKRIFIVMGHNGLNPSNGSKAMKGSYRAFVEKLELLCPSSVIYCCSLTPVTQDSTAAKGSNINNEAISQFNDYLKTLSDELGMVYIDINGKLLDSSGCLRNDLDEVDGLHLSGDTYELILSYLQKYITAAPEPKPSSKAAKAPSQNTADTTTTASSAQTVTSDPVESNSGTSMSETYHSEFFSNDLFIGDSITTGLYLYNILPAKNVAAAVGYTPYKAYSTAIDLADGTSGTALDYAISMQPKRIFLMLGSNGITSASAMEDSYKELIDRLHDKCPNSRLYCLSVTPVTKNSTSAASAGITLNMITDFNKFLKATAKDKNIKYIDLYSLFADSEGYFLDEYAEKDGLHFKGATYKIMLSHIEEVISNEE